MTSLYDEFLKAAPEDTPTKTESDLYAEFLEKTGGSHPIKPLENSDSFERLNPELTMYENTEVPTWLAKKLAIGTIRGAAGTVKFVNETLAATEAGNMGLMRYTLGGYVAGKIVQGMQKSRFATDYFPSSTLSKMESAMFDKAQSIEESGYNPTWKEEPLAWVVGAGTESAPLMTAALAATILTKSPTLGAAIYFAPTVGESYEKNEDSALSQQDKRSLAEIAGALEVAGNAIVFTKWFKPGVHAVADFLINMFTNGFQEAVTGFSQEFTDVFANARAEGDDLKTATLKATKAGMSVVVPSAAVGIAMAVPGELTASLSTAAENQPEIIDFMPKGEKRTEAWQYTQKEASQLSVLGIDGRMVQLVPPETHRTLVIKALAEGKPVSPEVLADYPGLTGGSPVQEPGLVLVPNIPERETPPPPDVSLAEPTNVSGEFAKEVQEKPIPKAVQDEFQKTVEKVNALEEKKTAANKGVIAINQAKAWASLRKTIAKEMLVRDPDEATRIIWRAKFAGAQADTSSDLSVAEVEADLEQSSAPMREDKIHRGKTVQDKAVEARIDDMIDSEDGPGRKFLEDIGILEPAKPSAVDTIADTTTAQPLKDIAELPDTRTVTKLPPNFKPWTPEQIHKDTVNIKALQITNTLAGVDDPIVRASIEQKMAKQHQVIETPPILTPQDPTILLYDQRGQTIEGPGETNAFKNKKRNENLSSIYSMSKKLGMNARELRQEAMKITGIWSMAGMTLEQTEALHNVLSDKLTGLVQDQAQQTMGLTDDEIADLSSRTKDPAIKRAVLTYYQHKLSEDPSIRKRQLADLQRLARNMNKRKTKVEKSYREDYKDLPPMFQAIRENWHRAWDKVGDIVKHGLFSSLDYFAALEEQTGRKLYEPAHATILAAVGSTIQANEQMDAVLQKHGFSKGATGDLSLAEAMDVNKYLYTGDEALLNTMSPKAKKAAAALMDILVSGIHDPASGPSATRLRSLHWKQLSSVYDHNIEKINILKDEVNSLVAEGTAELEKRKTDLLKVKAIGKEIATRQQEILAFENMLMRFMPANLVEKGASKAEKMKAIMDVLDQGKLAIVNDVFPQWLQRQTWGTRKIYFMSEADMNVQAELLNSLIALPDLPLEKVRLLRPFDIDSRELHQRETAGGELKGKNPFIAVRQHLSQLARMDETFWPLQRLRQATGSLELIGSEKRRIDLWIDNAMGKHQEIGDTLKVLNWAKRQWWRGRGWSIPFVGRFVGRNLPQNLLAAAHMAPGEYAKAWLRGVGQGFGMGDATPWMVEDLEKFGQLEVDERANMFSMLMLRDYGAGEHISTRIGQFMDLGAKSFGISDTINRTVLTWPGFWRGAYDLLGEWQRKEISTESLYNKLQMDTIWGPQRAELESYLAAKDYRTFARKYANLKTTAVHFGYNVLQRSMGEQSPWIRSIGGPMTFPRNVVMEWITNGTKPLFDGLREGNINKAWQGMRTIGMFGIIFSGLGWLYRELIGEDWYGLLKSGWWSPGSPEISTLTKAGELARGIYDDTLNERNEAAVKKMINVVDEVGLALGAPMVWGAVDFATELLENSQRADKLTHRDAILQLFDKQMQRKYGSDYERVRRDWKQKFLNATVGADETLQSEREREREKRKEPVERLAKDLIGID